MGEAIALLLGNPTSNGRFVQPGRRNRLISSTRRLRLSLGLFFLDLARLGIQVLGHVVQGPPGLIIAGVLRQIAALLGATAKSVRLLPHDVKTLALLFVSLMDWRAAGSRCLRRVSSARVAELQQ